MVRKLGVLGPDATTELNRFVVYLALPALLFDVVAHAKASDIWRPGFVAVFGLSSLIIFVLTLGLSLRFRRNLADAAIDGLNASYPNTGFMGFPLALAVFGGMSLPLTLIATLITVCAVFALAIVLIEIGIQSGRGTSKLVRKVSVSLIKNPLIFAPLLAAIVPAAGLTVAAPVEVFVKLLSAAASPCALIALGLFLAEGRPGAAHTMRPAMCLSAAKLALHPGLAWLLARLVGLPEPATQVVVMIAALPTGTGPFMLAELYDREAAVTSRTILMTTLISVVTLAAYLHGIGH